MLLCNENVNYAYWEVLQLLDKVIETIEENYMFSRGDKVIVAVSGGPDSICLLHILNRLKEKYSISLIAAHVNHCLRGEDSDKDEEFVHNFCESIGVECHSRRIDVDKISKQKNISCEMAGREARYEFFQELMLENKAQKIAIAHNANDQAETVLMRIIRGTGLEGLSGIKPVRDRIYVRPLIETSRKEIEEYCSIHNLSPRTDATNKESIYTRNKIRLELIPYIQDNFNSEIVNTLNRLAEVARIDNDYLQQSVEYIYKKYCHKKRDMVIINKKAFSEHEAVILRLIRYSILQLCGNLYNFEKIHIYDIMNVHRQNTGKKISLPGGIIAANNYGDVELLFSKDRKDDKKFYYKLQINKCNRINDIGANICLKEIEYNSNVRLISSSTRKYFDFDSIDGDIIVRNRNDGDKFIPLGMKGTKKLKDLFIDLKIEKDKRNSIPIICFGERIAWVVGCRISDEFKVNEQTKKVLEVNIESEE